jgi:hypothetical protein
MNPITPPSPPPDSEYEFDPIPEKFHAAACWWEYLRESSRARAAVAEYRKGELLLSPEVEPIRDILGINTAMIIASLAPDYPAKPWRDLSDEARDVAWSVISDELAPAVWIGPDGFAAGTHEVTPTKYASILNVRFPLLGGSKAAMGSSRRSALITVNWNANDDQILESIGDWLRKSRPEDLPNGKRRPRLSGGNQPFPALYNDALKWLRPCRLFHYLGTWQRVADELDPKGIHSPDAQKEMAGKARKIIRWLDGSDC